MSPQKERKSKITTNNFFINIDVQILIKCLSLIPVFRSRGKLISEFESCMVYKVSSKTVMATQRNLILKKKNKAKIKMF